MGKLSFRLGIGGTSDMLGKFSRTRLSQGSMSSSKLEAFELLLVLMNSCTKFLEKKKIPLLFSGLQ